MNKKWNKNSPEQVIRCSVTTNNITVQSSIICFVIIECYIILYLFLLALPPEQ